ncbi:MAG TPA: V-type ATP synthase subunit D [Steroidobacteraceae bacterium]|nr:V-type ATP synthase subunit D [Steroidobacteraceae bacterium]
MPEPRRELATTRAGLLELKDEQQLVQEGYRLLDEKRILLAGEIRRQLARLRVCRRELEQAEQAARAAFEAALKRHGLDSLAVHAPASFAEEALMAAHSRLLGLALLEARLRPPITPVPHGMAADAASAEVRECARAYRELLARAVALAACELTLRRLVREYVRTERRTRAIENILLPEIEAAVRLVEELLDGLDQEEFARLRHRLTRAAGSSRAAP